MENLATEAVLDRPVLLAQRCKWFDDCKFEYDGMSHARNLMPESNPQPKNLTSRGTLLESPLNVSMAGMEMRTDGSSFITRFRATAGLTYKFNATLQQSGGSFLRFAIYQPDSMGTAKTGGASSPPVAAQGCGDLPDLASGILAGAAAADDTTEMKLGAWAGPAAGGRSWAEVNNCRPDADRVGPPGQECSGSYRHFPGQVFNSSADWFWTCPFTATYLLQVTGNCECVTVARLTAPAFA